MSYFEDLRKHVGNAPLILPGSVVIIENEKGEILLQHRKDGGWGLPGGLMELGESFEETAIREVKEETGLDIDGLTQLHVYSGADQYLKVANGDEFYCVTAVYTAKEVKGTILIDEEESYDFRYFPASKLPKGILDNHKKYINDYLNKKEKTESTGD
ncbi:NUDIX hydrolase [Fictibacillus phosphorivorans]|uniref:NUDIX hydrolase n=1 Tax=Fictibacillus phosphorivorans TaxID=1221500 RepID=UPI002040621D|nr:NUDIX hydrolase [Fictibacillus phosphorivorans]MCM3720081.1 NUDIX hydrolase [Fictibacillus phosphorivorans]MCM3777771.1 NUDIX hydrolase [Fictibacillus phosphorivorans]